MAKKAYAFELKNDQSELEHLCHKCEELGKSVGLSDKSIFEMNLALDELFTNIISYGFQDHQEHIIKIKITVDDHYLLMRIEDDGIPFNPLESETPDLQCDLEKCQIGGLGIHLIKKMMDDVQYQRIAGKNVIFLKRKISPQPEQGMTSKK